MRRFLLALLLCAPVAAPSFAQTADELKVVERIRAEAFDRSEVMEIASWLTDVYGPRLTASPITKAAGDWPPPAATSSRRRSRGP